MKSWIESKTGGGNTVFITHSCVFHILRMNSWCMHEPVAVWESVLLLHIFIKWINHLFYNIFFFFFIISSIIKSILIFRTCLFYFFFCVLFECLLYVCVLFIIFTLLKISFSFDFSRKIKIYTRIHIHMLARLDKLKSLSKKKDFQ